MDADQENRAISKGSRRNRRKSSILKDSPGRPPLVSVEVNAPLRRPNKRVSFADTHTIKEFLATVGANTEWNSSYETFTNVVDSSHTMDLTNQSLSLDPERNSLMLGDAEQQLLGGKPNHTLSMNDTMAIPIAHSTMLPSPSVGLELDQQHEKVEKVGAENCSSSVASPSSGNVYHNSVLQPSTVNITANQTLDMEVTHINAEVLYKVGISGMNDADSPPGILSSLPNLKKEKKVTEEVPLPFLHSEQNKLEKDRTKMSSTDMDVTEAVFVPQTASRVEAPEEVIAINKTCLSSVNLELTEALLASNLVSFREIQGDRELVTGNSVMSQGNMEMTEALNPFLHSRETTYRPDVSKYSTSLEDKTRMGVANMELTKAVLPTISLHNPHEMEITRHDCTTDKTRTCLVNMELTKPVIFSQLKSSGEQNGKETLNHRISENFEKDLDLVNMKVTESFSGKGKRSLLSANMEMTEAVMPSISANYVDEIGVTKQAVTKEEKTNGSIASMEIVDVLVPSGIQDSERGGCMKINQEEVSGNRTRMKLTNMEMTEADVPSQLQDTESVGFVKISKLGPLTNDTIMGLANMEMTEAVIPSHLNDTESTGFMKLRRDMNSNNKVRMSVANMETTEAVLPYIALRDPHKSSISKQGVSGKDRTEKGSDNMEMTAEVVRSQSMIATASGIVEKCQQKMNMEHLETTESVISSQCMQYFNGVQVENKCKPGKNKRDSLANMEMTEAVVPSQFRGAESTVNVEIIEDEVSSSETRMSFANMEVTEAVLPFISMQGPCAKIISKSQKSGKGGTENMEETEAVRVSHSMIVDPPNVMFTAHEIPGKCEKKMDVEVTESLIPSQHIKGHEVEAYKLFHSGKDKTVSIANMEMTETIMPSKFQGIVDENSMEVYDKSISSNKTKINAANMETTEAAMPFISVGDCHAEMPKSLISGKDRTETRIENMEMTEAVRLAQSVIIESSNVIVDANDEIAEKKRKINKNNMEGMKSMVDLKCKTEKHFNSEKDNVILPNMEVTIFPAGPSKNHDESNSVKKDFGKDDDKVNMTHMDIAETIFSPQLEHVKMADISISRQMIVEPNMSKAKMQITEANFSSHHVPGKLQIDSMSHIVEKSKIRTSSEALNMTEPIPISPLVAADKEDCEGMSRNDIMSSSGSTKTSLQLFTSFLETSKSVGNKNSVPQIEHEGTSYEVLQSSSDIFANRMVQENIVPQGNASFVMQRNNIEKSSKQSEPSSDFHVMASISSAISLTRDVNDGGCATGMGEGNQRMHLTSPNMNSILSESNLICNLFDENEIKKSKVVKDISQTLQAGEEGLSYNKEDMEQKEIGNIQKDNVDEKNGKRSFGECDENIQPLPKRSLITEGAVLSSHDLSSPQRSVVERRTIDLAECQDALANTEPRVINTSLNNERVKAEISSRKEEISSRKEVIIHGNSNKSLMREQGWFEEELDNVSVDLMDSSNSMNSSTPGSPQMHEKQSTSSRRKSLFEEFVSEDPLYTSLLHKLSMVQCDDHKKNIIVEETPEKSSQSTLQKSVKDVETLYEAVVNKISVGSEVSPQRNAPPVNKSCSPPACLNQKDCAFAECDKMSLPSEKIICERSTPLEKGNNLGNYIEKKKFFGKVENIENGEDFVSRKNEVTEPKMNSQTTEGCQEASNNHQQSTSINKEDRRSANSYKNNSFISGGTIDEYHPHSLSKNQDGSGIDDAEEHSVESNHFPCNISERSGLLEVGKDIQQLQPNSVEEINEVFSAKKTDIHSNNIESTSYCRSEARNDTGIFCIDVTSHNEAAKPRAFENISFSLNSLWDKETSSKKQDESRVERKSFIEDFVANLSSSRISFVSMSESCHKNKDMSRNESLTFVDKKFLSSSETQRKSILEIQSKVKEEKETYKKTEEMEVEAEICCAGCSIADRSCIDNICGIRKWEVRERTATTITLGIQNSPLFVCLSLNKYDTHYLISSASWGPQACDLKKPMAQLVVNLFGCRANSCLIAMNSEPLCEVQKFLPPLAKTFKDISDLLLELFQVSAKYTTKFEQNSVKITLSSVEAHVSVDIWLHLTQPLEDPWQTYTIVPEVIVTIGNIRHSTFYAAITGVVDGPLKILRMADAACSIVRNMV